MPSRLRTVSSLSILALGVFVAVGALVGARPAAASTIAVHTLQSGIVHIASAGERAELHLLNASPYARNVKLELIDAAGLTKSVTSTVVQSGGQATIFFDPTKMTLVRGRILLNQQDGETEIQCNDFVASLEIVAAGDTPRTKVYVGDFNHIDP